MLSDVSKGTINVRKRKKENTPTCTQSVQSLLERVAWVEKLSTGSEGLRRLLKKQSCLRESLVSIQLLPPNFFSK